MLISSDQDKTMAKAAIFLFSFMRSGFEFSLNSNTPTSKTIPISIVFSQDVMYRFNDTRIWNNSRNAIVDQRNSSMNHKYGYPNTPIISNTNITSIIFEKINCVKVLYFSSIPFRLLVRLCNFKMSCIKSLATKNMLAIVYVRNKYPI